MPVVILLVLGFVGYDRLTHALQEHEAWQGSVTRVYQRQEYLSRRRRMLQFWEVRTSEGETRTIRIHSKPLWRAARPGDSVGKRSGQIDPYLHQSR